MESFLPSRNRKSRYAYFRENTEDIYAGIEWEQGTPEAKKFYAFLRDEMGVKKVRFPETSSFGVKPVSVEGTKRLVRAAILYALQHKLPSVTLVHKGNIMKFTEGGFKRWGYEVAETEFADRTFTMNQYNQLKKDLGEESAKAALADAMNTGKLSSRIALPMLSCRIRCSFRKNIRLLPP